MRIDPIDRDARNHKLFASFEHLIPRSFGGTNRQENLLLAHRKCNAKRGCKPAQPLFAPEAADGRQRI